MFRCAVYVNWRISPQVETIGDAYMLASGLPNRNGDNHAVEIANAAMDLLSGITNFVVDHKPGYKLQIRIGRDRMACFVGNEGYEAVNARNNLMCWCTHTSTHGSNRVAYHV